MHRDAEAARLEIRLFERPIGQEPVGARLGRLCQDVGHLGRGAVPPPQPLRHRPPVQILDVDAGVTSRRQDTRHDAARVREIKSKARIFEFGPSVGPLPEPPGMAWGLFKGRQPRAHQQTPSQKLVRTACMTKAAVRLLFISGQCLRPLRRIVSGKRTDVRPEDAEGTRRGARPQHDAHHGTWGTIFRMSLICLFPGQGSQSKGMGAELFDRYPDWTAEADAILGYSIRQLCVEDADNQLGLTQFTQPALYTVNALTYRARLDDGGAAPDFVAGHSLGEYNALQAAGVFSFGTGLQLVKQRGALMGQVSGGGMAAVIGLAPEQIQEVLESTEAGRRIDVANFNSFDQTVIAGPKDDLAVVKAQFEAAGVRAYIPLNVSAPFHSRYMRTAQVTFAAVLQDVSFAPPQIPVISNVSARPYEADLVRQTLSEQIGNSVRWLESMLFLLSQPDATFEEVGPGSVLSKLLAGIRKKMPR